MNAVTIHDLVEANDPGSLAFDLIDILRLAEADVVASTWTCRHVEGIGRLANQLSEISDNGVPVDGSEMLRLAGSVRQIIDGTFEAKRPESLHPWLVIRAVDSSFFMVISDDTNLLARLRARFHDVRDSPVDAMNVE